MSAVHDIAPLWPNEQSKAQRRLLDAAVAAFARRGYGGTATRDIARAAGMSPTAMYIYYPSKADLLYAICRNGHQAVLRTVEEAVARAGDTSSDRVYSLIASFVAWHAVYHEAARVAQYELHALPEEKFAEIADLRRQIERFLRAEIEAGVAAGAFDADPPDAARAMLSLGIDVARWYTSRHRHSPWELAEIYAGLGMRMINAELSSSDVDLIELSNRRMT